MNKHQLLNIKKMIFELGRGGSKNHFFDRVNKNANEREVERFFAFVQNDAGSKMCGAGARGFCAPHIFKTTSGHQLSTGLRGFFSKNKESEKNKIPAYKFIREFYFIDAVRRYSGKSAQTGRSMLEMLGVLAIIGVLSVGAIMGFRYAMNRHKANETIYDVMLRATNVPMAWDNYAELHDFKYLFPELRPNDVNPVGFAVETWAEPATSKYAYRVEVADVPSAVCRQIIALNPPDISLYKAGSAIDRTGIHATQDDCGSDKTNMYFLFEEGWVDPTPTPDPDPECESDTDCGENYTCQDGVCVCSLVNCGACQGLDSSACRCTNLCTSDQVCNDGVCECSEGCTSDQTQDPTTCACSCIDTTQEMWNGKCVPKCDADGMTGERDENGQCTCEAGLDAETCKCPEGTIFVDGTCQELHCIESASVSNTYECYLNGKLCGLLCSTPTPKNENDCFGYCDPKFCDGKGTWVQRTLSWSGFGCVAPNGFLCGTTKPGFGSWVCAQNTNVIGNYRKDICCESDTFGQCDRGTCTPADCNAFGGEYLYVADQHFGCKITKNNNTAYCVPYNDSWLCQYSSAYSLAVSPYNPNFCGLCSASDLAGGNCGNCFNGIKNCPWGTYNAELDRCVGTLNGIEMSCDFAGRCYYGATSTSNRCANGCNTMTPGNFSVCSMGMCDKTACPAGSDFVYMPITSGAVDEFDIYGCQTTRNGYTFFYKDGNWGYNSACFIDGGKTLCGGFCTKDCSSCEVYYHEACTPSNKCLKNGSLVDGCTCEGTVSNGHCCEKGHLYLNGGCTLLSCPEGKCVTDGGLCKTLTSDICRDDSGLCQTVGDEFARDDNTGACVSK